MLFISLLITTTLVPKFNFNPTYFWDFIVCILPKIRLKLELKLFCVYKTEIQYVSGKQ